MPRQPAKPVDKKARFAKLMASYKQYDPSVDGYGSVSQWRESWEQVMGVEQAQEVLGDDNPLTILGLTKTPTREILKSAYRKKVMENQDCFRADATPDQQAKAKRIIAAYSMLEAKITA